MHEPIDLDEFAVVATKAIDSIVCGLSNRMLTSQDLLMAVVPVVATLTRFIFAHVNEDHLDDAKVVIDNAILVAVETAMRDRATAATTETLQ